MTHLIARHPCRADRSHRAFSLIEMIVVLVIIGVLAAVALPRFSGALDRERAKAAAQRIVADVSLAQRTARSTSASRNITFDSGDASYTLSDVTDLNRSTLTDYTVSLAAEPYRAQITAVDFGGDETIVFDGFGEPDSGGTITITVGAASETITVGTRGKATWQKAQTN